MDVDNLLAPAVKLFASVLFVVLFPKYFLSLAIAQEFPVKQVRIVVPTAPGGSVDIVARILGQKLSANWGQQVVADNRPGAGGTLGAEIVARAAADGYTILVASSNFAISASLYRKLSYDPIRDFAAVSLLGSIPNLLVIHPSVPARSVSELIGLARAKPRQLNYASSGNGTSPHLTAELFKTMSGIEMVHIPYRGANPAFTDLVAGHVHVMFASIISLLPYVKSERVRALAVTSNGRSSALPELPTVAEVGVPGFEVTSWTSILAPAATPKKTILLLNAAMNRALQATDVKESLLNKGYDLIGSTPEACEAFIKAEISKWSMVVRRSGMLVN